jgi:hypothetical protein
MFERRKKDVIGCNSNKKCSEKDRVDKMNVNEY